MLINFSNHSSKLWGEKQLRAATDKYGEIVDIPFPLVDPGGSTAYIRALAEKYLQEILRHPHIQAVHIMGEQNLCFLLIKMLQAKGICCLASTTRRNPPENKEEKFSFEQFREYQ
ncbi:CRISPR-associated protein [Candidatus Avelusimicrobium faecicola]|uniref:CRISPR-associated protein n=1 Tax=Candidatus Avelusimicrobium faecicola TaxID=3416205 RepID=UPI003D0BA0CD